MADEQPKVEQTAEPAVSHETTEKEQPKQETEAPVNKFSEEQVNEIVKARLAKDRASMYNKLGVDDLDTAINAIKLQKEADEKTKIQRGEFEKIIKEKSEESEKRINSLQSELRDIKVNKALLSSASRNKAINPDQVVELLNKNINLNESGTVEILDKNGIARYNSKGELLTTDELVQEFLTQNPHFVSASPSGSGSVSNVDRSELSKPFNLSDLNMNNKEDRERYAKYRQDRNSKPTVIQNKT